MTKNDDTARSGIVFWALRLAGSIIVLGVIFYFLPIETVFAAARTINPLIWLFGLGVFIAGHLIAAMKWRLLIHANNEIAVQSAFRAHFAGLAANLCLPGVAGGDIVRAGLIMRDADDKPRIAFGSLIDRLLDVLGLLLLALIGGLWVFGGGVLDVRFFALLGVSVAGIGTAIGAYLIIRRLRFSRTKKITDKLDGLILEFANAPGKLGLCLGLSMAVQSAFIAVTAMLAGAVNANTALAEWVFAWPLAKLVAILPVSLAGLGVREAGLAAILSGFGADPAAVVAASLLWQGILFAGGGLGAVFLLFSRRNARQTHELTPNQDPAANK